MLVQKQKFKPVEVYIDRWARYEETIDLHKPNAYLGVGGKDSGKSSLMEALGSQHKVIGGTIIDLGSSQDCEGLGWCRSGLDRILFLADSNFDLKCSYPYMSLDDFKIEELRSYDVVVTVPSFYSTEGHENLAISRIIDMFYTRQSWDVPDFVLIREAYKIIYSRLLLGYRSEVAKAALVKFVKEARHSGFAIGLDSQRPMSVDIDVRDLIDYVFVKRLGRVKLPEELTFLYSFVQPSIFHRLPQNRFVLAAKMGGVAIGGCEFPPFHKTEHENLLKMFDIVIEEGEPVDLEEVKERQRKADEETHREIINLRATQRLSYSKISARLQSMGKRLSEDTVRREVDAHEVHNCICYNKSINA